MHRSYYPTTPASSKLLQKRWDENHYRKHRISVEAVKPEIDSSPPITFMHLHLKLKKLQLEEERLATIERDNRILLEKMSHIMRTNGRIDNSNNVEYKSLSRDRRQRELLRISKENMRMMRRIRSKKSSLSVEKLERDWRRNLRYMDNISAFPEEWYLMKDDGRQMNVTSRSNPNLSSNRSGGAKSSRRDDDDKSPRGDERRSQETKSAPAPAQKDKDQQEKKDSTDSNKKDKSSPRKKESTKEAPPAAAENEKKYEDDFE